MSDDIFPALETGYGDTQTERGEQSVLWLHIPATEPTQVIMLSVSPVRYRGHWFLGRMSPCTGDACPFCSKRLGSQVRYAYSVYLVRERRQCLFEVGAYTAGLVQGIAKEYGAHRGLVVTFEKSGSRDRGRIEAYKSTWPAMTTLPAAQDVAGILMAGWRIANERISEMLTL